MQVSHLQELQELIMYRLECYYLSYIAAKSSIINYQTDLPCIQVYLFGLLCLLNHPCMPDFVFCLPAAGLYLLSQH